MCTYIAINVNAARYLVNIKKQFLRKVGDPSTWGEYLIKGNLRVIVMKLHAQCNMYIMACVLHAYVMELQSVWKRMRSLTKEVTYVTKKTLKMESSGRGYAYHE